MQETADRQGLLEPNPLLKHIPQFADLKHLARSLSVDPLRGLDMRGLDVLQRGELLATPEFTFEPTAQSLQAAVTLLNMIRGSYRARSPLQADTRRRVWDLLDAGSRGERRLPPLAIGQHSALVVKGVTGTGKTALVHALRTLLPETIEHGPCAEAGWTSLRQLVHLYTSMSHDGSRAGFLTGILVEMDRALGTDYAETLGRRYRSVENLAVRTVAQLHAHYTGIVFVDEGQLTNLVEARQAQLMQLFLLSIINAGIPLVLIGNPLAFGWTARFSQDTRRLYTRPPVFLHPVGAVDSGGADSDWRSVWQGISRFWVLRDSVADPAACSATLRRCSGGIPGLAMTLWRAAQQSALERERESVTPASIQAAYEDPGFDPLRELADGFAARNPLLLARFTDVPHALYGRAWGRPLGEGGGPAATSARRSSGADKPKAASNPRSPRSEAAKFTAQRTREAAKERAREEMQSSLAPEDMRAQGVSQSLIAGLDALQAHANGET